MTLFLGPKERAAQARAIREAREKGNPVPWNELPFDDALILARRNKLAQAEKKSMAKKRRRRKKKKRTMLVFFLVGKKKKRK